MKKKKWWVKFFESSVEMASLDYRRRGVIYTWLLSLEGIPVSKKLLCKTLLGDFDGRGYRKNLTELIDDMIVTGLIVNIEDDKIALPGWLVRHLIDSGSGSIGQYHDHKLTPGEPFLGLNVLKPDDVKSSGEDAERVRMQRGLQDQIKIDERESEKPAEPGSLSLSVSSNSVSSLSPISGASEAEVLSVVAESDRLYAISYPSSAPDRTSGYEAIRQKVKDLIEEHGCCEVEKRVRIAYSQGLKWVEDEGEDVTLAAIVNGFQYITEKKKSTAQPKGRMVIKAGTYEPTEDSFPGLKFDPEIAAAGLQERQNGG